MITQLQTSYRNHVRKEYYESTKNPPTLLSAAKLAWTDIYAKTALAVLEPLDNLQKSFESLKFGCMAISGWKVQMSGNFKQSIRHFEFAVRNLAGAATQLALSPLQLLYQTKMVYSAANPSGIASPFEVLSKDSGILIPVGESTYCIHPGLFDDQVDKLSQKLYEFYNRQEASNLKTAAAIPMAVAEIFARCVSQAVTSVGYAIFAAVNITIAILDQDIKPIGKALEDTRKAAIFSIALPAAALMAPIQIAYQILNIYCSEEGKAIRYAEHLQRGCL